ncbi:unnamed protein product, partial [marine sediment metagenome]
SLEYPPIAPKKKSSYITIFNDMYEFFPIKYVSLPGFGYVFLGLFSSEEIIQ